MDKDVPPVGIANKPRQKEQNHLQGMVQWEHIRQMERYRVKQDMIQKLMANQQGVTEY